MNGERTEQPSRFCSVVSSMIERAPATPVHCDGRLQLARSGVVSWKSSQRHIIVSPGLNEDRTDAPWLGVAGRPTIQF